MKNLAMVLIAVLALCGMSASYLLVHAMHEADTDTWTIENNFLELSDVVVSMLPTSFARVDEYVDISVSLDSSVGMFGFLFNIVFDETKLMPVSIIDGDRFNNLRLVLPVIGEGARSNRFVFSAQASDVSYETGVIATMRFRVGEGVNIGALPIAFGTFMVMVDDRLDGMEIESVSTGNNFPSLNDATNPGIRARGGIMPFQEYIDITDDFECPNFLDYVRDMIGVYNRPIYNVDMLNASDCCIILNSTMEITSLAGIQHINDIGSLTVVGTEIDDLDLTTPNMKNLGWIMLTGNQLTTLDLRNNPELSDVRINEPYMLLEDLVGWEFLAAPSHPGSLHFGPPMHTLPLRPFPTIDITADFECENFLTVVRELTGVFDRPLLNTDILNLGNRHILDFSGRGITSLAGIEHFRVIFELDVSDNTLTELNLPTKYTRSLRYLDAARNQLEKLDISHIPYWSEIDLLDVRYNYMQSLESVVYDRNTSYREVNFHPQNVIQLDKPSVIVLTNITERSGISVVYTAQSGAGASISEISYSINGNTPQVVYLSGSINDFEPITATLPTGANEIIFTIIDSVGREGVQTLRFNVVTGTTSLQMNRQ